MKMKSVSKLLCLLVPCVFLMTSCDNDDPVQPDKTLKIGVLMPLTGSAASTGESVSAALDIALTDLNQYLKSTGNDLSIELAIRDTGADPATAQQELEGLDADGIRYVIGPYSSADVAATLDYANQNDMLLLSPSSVASALAIANDNCYRLVPSDRNQAEAIAALFMHDQIEAVIPVVRDDVWGDGLLSDVTDRVAGEGISMYNAIQFNPTQVDAADIASQIAAAVSQVSAQTPASKIGVYVLSFGEGTEILESASQAGIDASVKWYGSSAFANNGGLLGSNSARAFAQQQAFRCPAYAPEPSAEDLWGPIEAQLTTELGRTPEVYALTCYDALWVLTLSYVLCEDPGDLVQYKTSLRELTSYYNGITGRTTLDEFGDRKYASFNFWGLEEGTYDWKSFGYYNNATGQLVVE